MAANVFAVSAVAMSLCCILAAQLAWTAVSAMLGHCCRKPPLAIANQKDSAFLRRHYAIELANMLQHTIAAHRS